MAHSRRSRPDSGLDIKVKVPKNTKLVGPDVTSCSLRYMIRFTSSKDGFFEKASGGAEKVEAGARLNLARA